MNMQLSSDPNVAPVASVFNDKDQLIKILKAKINVGVLPPRDETFAQDLISGKFGYETRGYLSENQWKWVKKLAMGETKTTEQVGDLSTLMMMFKSASAHLKRPKFAVEHDDGNQYVNTYQFTMAKPDSANPGYLYLKRNGQYIGKVSPDSEFSRGRDCLDGDVKFLHAFSADPIGFAKQHGKLTGQCCFCNRPLDTPESTEAGYGPVCAKRYGLKWG